MKIENVPANVLDTVDAELLEGEELLWVGQPNPIGAAMGPTLLRDLSPLIIMGFFFAFFFTIIANEVPMDDFPAQFMLLPVGIIMLTTLWPIVARFMGATRSVYAITDRRALIINGGSVKSYGPDDIDYVERKMRGQNSGNLLFANEIDTRYNSSNRSTRVTSRPVGFLGIDNVREVEAIMLRALRDVDDDYDKRKRKLYDDDVYEDDAYTSSSSSKQRASYK